MMRSSRSSRTAVLFGGLVGCIGCSEPTSNDPGDPGPRVVLARIAGDSQAGFPGVPLQDSLRVRLLDGEGTPIAGELVRWSAGPGAGSVAPDTSRTDAAGTAAASWTLTSVLSGGQSFTGTATADAAGLRTSFSATVTLGNWNWRKVEVPVQDLPLIGVVVDPTDDRVWYVWGLATGLFITHDAGESWMKAPFPVREGQRSNVVNRRSVVLDPANSARVFAADFRVLYKSEDQGRSWTELAAFGEPNRSLHVSPRDGAIFFAPQWPLSREGPTTVPGMYRSMDGGISFQHFPYGIPLGTAVLTWQIAEDPATGTLFLGNEIADHPVPYQPPFLRSRDRGASWEDIAPAGWWHASSVQIAPDDGAVYALLEGANLQRSTDGGDTWLSIAGMRDGWELFIDPAHPHRFFVGEKNFRGELGGGLLLSVNRAQQFWEVGFNGRSVHGMAVNGTGTKAYAVVNDATCSICPDPSGGLYVGDVPAALP